MARAIAPEVLAARARRPALTARRAAQVEWFGDQVQNRMDLTMRQRVMIATEMLKTKVVQNISRPVTKHSGPRGGLVVTNRSKPGEFPKVDTALLMQSIFSDHRQITEQRIEGYVGTPIDYGVILEMQMQRSFLRRTLDEQRPTITRVLTGPIR